MLRAEPRKVRTRFFTACLECEPIYMRPPTHGVLLEPAPCVAKQSKKLCCFSFSNDPCRKLQFRLCQPVLSFGSDIASHRLRTRHDQDNQTTYGWGKELDENSLSNCQGIIVVWSQTGNIERIDRRGHKGKSDNEELHGE